MKSNLRRRSSRFGVSLAITVAASSVMAASASAFSIDSIAGGPGYTGAFGSDQSFQLGTGGMTLSCNTSTVAGATHNVVGDLASTDFLPAFSSNVYTTGVLAGSCPGGLLPPYKIANAGNWRLTATGSPAAGVYDVAVTVLPGSTMTWKTQYSPTCTVSFGSTGNANLTGSSLGAKTDAAGTRIYGVLEGMTYTVSSGCPSVPAGTRTNGTLNFGGSASSGGLAIGNVAINP